MWGEISWGFWFIFPDISDVEYLFMYLLTISMSSLEKMPIKTSSDHFKIRLFVSSCMSYLYILDNNPLLDISFANVFSHSVSCLFVSLMVYIAVQKLLSLSRTHLFTFAFVSLAQGDRSQKILLRPMSRSTAHIFFQEFYSFRSCT